MQVLERSPFSPKVRRLHSSLASLSAALLSFGLALQPTKRFPSQEVRLGSYSPNAAVLPPAAIVASKAMAKDPRAEPKYAERIRYVVVHGEPGARLVDMVSEEHLDAKSEIRKGLTLAGFNHQFCRLLRT